MSSFQTVHTCGICNYMTYMDVNNTPFSTYCDTLDLMIIKFLYVISTIYLENQMDICTCYTTVSPTTNQECGGHLTMGIQIVNAPIQNTLECIRDNVL
jgi:hypothetical protein